MLIAYKRNQMILLCWKAIEKVTSYLLSTHPKHKSYIKPTNSSTFPIPIVSHVLKKSLTTRILFTQIRQNTQQRFQPETCHFLSIILCAWFVFLYIIWSNNALCGLAIWMPAFCMWVVGQEIFVGWLKFIE